MQSQDTHLLAGRGKDRKVEKVAATTGLLAALSTSSIVFPSCILKMLKIMHE